MFDFLFGEGQYAIKLVVGLIVVIGLLAAFFWGLRRFGGERLGSSAARGRQPRLAVIDAATVDGRRRLVLIRRDNVEHLLIIGGPTDVVVEQNIVRGAPAAPARAPAGDTVPRGVPLGEGTMWPLQPEPARTEPMARAEPVPRAEPMPRAEPLPRLEAAPRQEPPPRPPRAAPPPPLPAAPAVDEQMQWSAEPEQPPVPPPQRERRPRAIDPLAGLAEELSRVPTAPEPADMEELPREQPSREPQMREAPVRDALPRQPLPRREPRAARPQLTPPQPPPAASAPEPQFNSSADQNLAEMAQRLEAALRRPANAKSGDEGRGAAAAPRAAEPAEDEMEEAPPPTPPARASAPAEIARPQRGEAPRAPRAAPAQPAPQKSLYDSLEQEMASLLGRPNSKP